MSDFNWHLSKQHGAYAVYKVLQKMNNISNMITIVAHICVVDYNLCLGFQNCLLMIDLDTTKTVF